MSAERKRNNEMGETLVIPPDKYHFHPLRLLSESKEDLTNLPVTVHRVEAAPGNQPPEYSGRFYPVNIGSKDDPRILELRFQNIDHDTLIALLMTEERTPRDLEAMASGMLERFADKGITDIGAVIGTASLGTLLSTQLAQQLGPDTLHLSVQKGKIGPDGKIVPPKPWISMESGIEMTSGTSTEGVVQMGFVDPEMAELLAYLQTPTVWVDDARLTRQTSEQSLELLRRMGINVVGAATVLNEAEPTDFIGGDIPYVALTKSPLFTRSDSGLIVPKEGTYDGLDDFYIVEE